MLFPNESLDYNKPRSKNGSKKLIIIGVIIIATVLIGLVIFLAIRTSGNPETNNSAGTVTEENLSVEEKFLKGLADNKPELLVDSVKFISTKRQASGLIENQQEFIVLEECTNDRTDPAITIEEISYYQHQYSCPMKSDQENPISLRMIITISEDQIVYLETITEKRKVKPVAEIHESFLVK